MKRQRVIPTRQTDRQGKTFSSKSAVPTRGPVHPILRIQQTIGNQAVSRLIQTTSRRGVCGPCSGRRSVAHVNTDGLPASSIADPFFIAIDGPPTPEMTIRHSMATPSILRQPVPAPNSVRVVRNHQFPITAGHVGLGWRSGFGGVSEIEVSNGTTNYNGTNISEHFLFGLGNNSHIGGCNNQSGQGGQGGSTFTVGRGVSFSLNGLNINLPAKRNTFYDMHIKGFGVNILPPGTNFQFSLCLQRYSFGGRTIFGRMGGLLPAFFYRFHGIERKTVGGQDVANINLSKG